MKVEPKKAIKYYQNEHLSNRVPLMTNVATTLNGPTCGTIPDQFKTIPLASECVRSCMLLALANSDSSGGITQHTAKLIWLITGFTWWD